MLRPLIPAGKRWLTRARRLLWPVLEQFSSPASQLILAPLLLSRLGAEQFGLGVLGLSLLFAAPLLSLGRSSALMVMVSQLDAQSRPAGRLVWHVLAQVARAVPLLLLACVLAGPWLPLPASFDTRMLALYVGLALLLLALTEIDNTLACALKGYARFDVAAITETAGRALHVLACYALVARGSGVLAVLSVSAAVLALKAWLKLYCLRRLMRWRAQAQAASASAPAASVAAQRREMLRLGLWNCLQVLSGLSFYAFDRWLVGYVAGAAVLGSYAICSQYTQFAHSITSAASQPLVPWIARQTLADGTVRDPARVRRVALGAGVLCCLPVGAAWLLSGPALSWWIDPGFAASNHALVQRLSLAFLLLALNVPFINLLLGLKQARFVALLTLAAGAWLLATALAWPPADALWIANLKIGYAFIALLSVARLMHLLRRQHTA